MAEPGAEQRTRTETGEERQDDDNEELLHEEDAGHEEDAETCKRARREMVRAIMCGLLSYRQRIRTETWDTTARTRFFVAVSDLIDDANDEMTQDGVHLRCMVRMVMFLSWSNQPRQEVLKMLRSTLMVIFTFKGLFFESDASSEDDRKREERWNEAQEDAQKRRSEEQLDALGREEGANAAPKERTGVSTNEATLEINWGRILTFLATFCTMAEWLRERQEHELTVEEMIDETCAFFIENLDDWISQNGDWDTLEIWAKIQKCKRRQWSVGFKEAAVAVGLVAATVAFFLTLESL